MTIQLMFIVLIVEQKEFEMDIESKYIYVTSFYQPGSILLKLEKSTLFLRNLPSITLKKKILLVIYDCKENKIYDEVIYIRRHQTYIVFPMKSSGIYFLRIYVQENFFGDYRGLLFKSDVPFYLSSSGDYRFIETVVAAPNRDFLLKMPNPVSISCFQERIKITNLARQIVNDLSNTYDRILAIHDWVAENIYYDFDALSHLNDRSICLTKPLDVITARRSVCQGYTDLSIALMRSIGIPAIGNGSYATSDHQAATHKTIKPSYDNSSYTDVEIFMPYNELEVGTGKHYLKFYCKIWEYSTSSAISVAESQYYSFTLTNN